jgi:hypothetical protein
MEGDAEMADLDLNEDAKRENLVPAWFLSDKGLGMLDRALRNSIPPTDPIRSSTVRDRNLILAGRTAMVAVCLSFMSVSKATRERLSMEGLSVGDTPVGNRVFTVEAQRTLPSQEMVSWKPAAESILRFEDDELPALDEEGLPLPEETVGKLVRHLVIDYFSRNASWTEIARKMPRHLCGTGDPGELVIPEGTLETMDGQFLPRIDIKVDSPDVIVDDPDAELSVEAETGR